MKANKTKFICASRVLMLTFALSAANCTWTGAAGDGKWSTAENWSGNTKPINGNLDIYTR